MKKEIGIGSLLLLLCIVSAIIRPQFISPFNLQNNARLIGMNGIFSIGMGLVIITGGIDLSVGSVFALQGVLLSIMLNEWHLAWPVAILANTAGVLLIGLFNGLFIAKVRMQPFIVTLCGLLFYRGMARFVAQDETKAFNGGYPLLRTLATGSVGPIPMPFVLLIVVSIVTYVLLHRSVYGRYLYAVGRNEDAARYSGINAQMVMLSAYMIEALLVALAGILFAFYTPSISPANYGNAYELYGIAAAVLGGCSLRGGEGSIVGILIGTALLQVLRNMVNLLGIPSSLEYSVMGAVIFIGVLVDQVVSRRRKGQKVITIGAVAPSAPAPLAPGATGQ